jgi:hypothetical protein
MTSAVTAFLDSLRGGAGDRPATGRPAGATP